MTTLFPFLAAILAVLALVISGPKPRVATSIPAYGGAVFLYLVAALVAFKFRPGEEAISIAEGYGIGLIAAKVGSLLSIRAGSKLGSCVCALACGVMAGGAVHLLHSGKPMIVQLSLLAGCGVTALIVDLAEDSMASLVALAAAAVVCGDLLGLLSLNGNSPGYAGTMLALAGSGVGLVAVATNRYSGGWIKQAIPVGLVAILSCAGFLISKRWPDLHEAAVIFPVACAAGLAVHWMMPPDEDSNTLRLGIATIIWCSLATFGFGYLKSFGTALCLAGATCTLLILGNPRALSSLIPLAMLTLYRVFRTTYADNYQAVDIGQNYALIGFAVGAIAALLPVEWLRGHSDPAGRPALGGMVIWALYSMAIPALVLLLLGERGIIGFLLGLGLSPLVARWHGRASLGVISLSVGLGGVTILSYGWLSDFLDLGRDDKMRDFGYMAAALVVGGIALSLLSRNRAQGVAS